MKRIKLTQGKYALVDDSDYEYLNQWKWCAIRDRGNWYATKGGFKTKLIIKMHRLILGVTDPKV